MRLRSLGRIMAVQPILQNTTENLSDIKYSAFYGKPYFDLGNTEIDDSHIHSCFEIYINVSGSVSFLHGSTVSDITYGDAVISHPSDVHHCIYNESCMHEHFCIWLTGGFVEKFLTENNLRGRIRLSSEDKEKLIFIATKLCSKNSSEFLKTTYLFELIALLSKKDGTTSDLENNYLPDKLREILSYIDANYLTILNSEEICKRFYISQSTLNRNFKKFVGISVGDLIEAKRLSHAERLIRNGASVTDACYLSGFNDCSRFIIKFKQKFLKTPLKYRQELANKN